MTNEQILTKAIEKAVEGGISNSGAYKAMISDGGLDFLVAMNSYRNTIFSHSFAKAFWGKGLVIYLQDLKTCSCYKPIYVWQYHLIRMVLEPEPLKYIEKFL